MTSMREVRAADEACARLALEVTGYALGIMAEEMSTLERGNHRAAYGRQVAMYVCHVSFEMSLSRVAAAFARDRSTASYACHVVEERRERDGAFDAWLSDLEAVLRNAPARRSGEQFAA